MTYVVVSQVAGYDNGPRLPTHFTIGSDTHSVVGASLSLVESNLL